MILLVVYQIHFFLANPYLRLALLARGFSIKDPMVWVDGARLAPIKPIDEFGKFII